MENTNKVFLGTQLKLNVNIEPIEEVSMSQYDWVIEAFCTPSNAVVINKNNAKRVDDNNYLIMIDTEKVGIGVLKCEVTAGLRDRDFGTRTEVTVINTGIEIVKV